MSYLLNSCCAELGVKLAGFCERSDGYTLLHVYTQYTPVYVTAVNMLVGTVVTTDDAPDCFGGTKTKYPLHRAHAMMPLRGLITQSWPPNSAWGRTDWWIHVHTVVPACIHA